MSANRDAHRISRIVLQPREDVDAALVFDEINRLAAFRRRGALGNDECAQAGNGVFVRLIRVDRDLATPGPELQLHLVKGGVELNTVVVVDGADGPDALQLDRGIVARIGGKHITAIVGGVEDQTVLQNQCSAHRKTFTSGNALDRLRFSGRNRYVGKRIVGEHGEGAKRHGKRKRPVAAGISLVQSSSFVHRHPFAVYANYKC